MNILPKPLDAFIIDVSFEDNMLQAFLNDGRKIRVPPEYFPALRDATPDRRQNWRLIGRGAGIHGPELDEDISLEGLLIS